MHFTTTDHFRLRVFMTIAGISICSVGVGFLSHSSMGLDPFQVFCHGLWNLTPIGYGTFSAIVCSVMFVIIFFWNRSKIGIGTIYNMFVCGYIIEFSEWLLKTWNPEPTPVLRFLSLIIGIVLICFSASMYFTADLGVSVYDAVALTISERHRKLKFQYIRVTCDVICVIIGFSLGATAGIGTVITAFFMGPLIAFFNRTFSLPLLYGGKENIPADKR